MPSRKRRRTPPAAPAPAPAAPVPVAAPMPPLRETFALRHFLAAGALVIATVPALLTLGWSGAADNTVIAVVALLLINASAWIFDQEQWVGESRRQMLLTLGFGVLAVVTAPAVPFSLIIPVVLAAILEFKRGWGAASALMLGSGVAYAAFGVDPVGSYPFIIGMAWPAIGANVMRRIALAGTGHGPMTVLGRRRW